MAVPIVVAHRGFAARYPENTLLALREAVACGVRYLECDVQLSADATPYLHHDGDLLRSAGREQCIFDLTDAQLAEIKLNRLRPEFSDTPLSPLHELVDFLREHPEVTVFVEIKEESLRHYSARALVQAVLDTLQPVLAQCVIISYIATIVQVARQQGARIGWVIETASQSTRETAQAMQPEFLFVNHLRLPPVDDPLRQGPWRWAVYEVTSVELALRLGAQGVDMVETMAVDTLMGDAQLKARAARGA